MHQWERECVERLRDSYGGDHYLHSLGTRKTKPINQAPILHPAVLIAITCFTMLCLLDLRIQMCCFRLCIPPFMDQSHPDRDTPSGRYHSVGHNTCIKRPEVSNSACFDSSISSDHARVGRWIPAIAGCVTCA